MNKLENNQTAILNDFKNGTLNLRAGTSYLRKIYEKTLHQNQAPKEKLVALDRQKNLLNDLILAKIAYNKESLFERVKNFFLGFFNIRTDIEVASDLYNKIEYKVNITEKPNREITNYSPYVIIKKDITTSEILINKNNKIEKYEVVITGEADVKVYQCLDDGQKIDLVARSEMLKEQIDKINLVNSDVKMKKSEINDWDNAGEGGKKYIRHTDEKTKKSTYYHSENKNAINNNSKKIINERIRLLTKINKLISTVPQDE